MVFFSYSVCDTDPANGGDDNGGGGGGYNENEVDNCLQRETLANLDELSSICPISDISSDDVS